MVNKTKVHEHIVRLVQEKRIEGITAVRDESNREGVRFVIEVKRDASAKCYPQQSLQDDTDANQLWFQYACYPKWCTQDFVPSSDFGCLY